MLVTKETKLNWVCILACSNSPDLGESSEWLGGGGAGTLSGATSAVAAGAGMGGRTGVDETSPGDSTEPGTGATASAAGAEAGCETWSGGAAEVGSWA